MPVIAMSADSPCPTKVSGRQCIELKNVLEENNKLREENHYRKNIIDDLQERLADLLICEKGKLI